MIDETSNAALEAERLARIAAHQRRIEAESQAASIEDWQAERLARIEARKAVLLSQKKKAKRAKVPYLNLWLHKIDWINRMAANPGWSL